MNTMVSSKRSRQTMIIIGAGIGGLATGCYAQMNGYQSHIFELHEIPGGCCTGWKRGDFTFDVCVSWLLGSGPGNELHQIWLELGALQGKEMRNFDVFNAVETTAGHTVRFYSNPDRLEAHLAEISPDDIKQIREFCNGLRRFQKCLAAYPFLKPVGLMGTFEKLRMYLGFLPYFRLISKSITTLMTDYSARFKSPVLREAFNFILYEKMPKFPVLPFYFQLACHAGKSAGVPEGGSLGLAHSVEARYKRLGGQVTYNAQVEEILVENDRAVGIRLSNGQEHFADVIVSASDGYQTIMKFLKGKYVNDTYSRLYTHTINQPGMIFPGYFTLFLGLKGRPLPEAEHCTTHLLTDAEAKELPGILHPSINVQLRSRHYPELSPPGTSVIFATYFCDIAPWRALNDGEERVSRLRRGNEIHTLPVRRGGRYAREKKRVAELMTSYLDKKYPGLASAVVIRDISTPLTQVRYTGNYNGTVLQWQPFVEGGETLEKEINKHGPVLPGLQNFYMSGVWVTSGGLIRAAVAGRHVVQFICKEDGKTFTAHIDDTGPLPTHVVVPAAVPRAKGSTALPGSAGLGAPQSPKQTELAALATGPESDDQARDDSAARVKAPEPASQRIDL
jgi:phytoene dehydrogenase-like protein